MTSKPEAPGDASTVSSGIASGETQRQRALTVAMSLVLLLLCIAIGCAGLSRSGPLWPDGAQYANAGAMVHDWLRSGSILHPYEFAKQNYAQYPAFHIPYHPPAYPVLLGVFFMVTGVSYTAARIFIALCLWASGCLFLGILRRSGVRNLAAFGCSLLLVTAPEVAFWSRDSMSEIPGLALVLAGTYVFVRWLSSGASWEYVLAFVFAEAAFFSRFLTAGVLPAWFLVAFFAGKLRRRSSPALWLPPVLYFTVNGAWVLFTQRWSKYEAGSGSAGPVRNYSGPFAWKLISFYVPAIPAIVGWMLLISACIGLVITLRGGAGGRWKYLWPLWLLSYCIFIWGVGIYDENRYLIYVVPAFAGLAASLFEMRRSLMIGYRRYVLPALFCLCLFENIHTLINFPGGTVGYEAVGKKLASLSGRGNILVYSFEQAHLIFQYRSHKPGVARSFIRGDRSLAVRAPNYTAVQPEFRARFPAEVLDIIRRGRIRYIVTSPLVVESVEPRELTLLNEVLNSRPDTFRKVGDFPLLVQYAGPGTSVRVLLWEYMGELPEGPSEIPVMVPTADMVIQPT